MAKSKYIPKYTYEIVTESKYTKYIIVYVDDKVLYNGKTNNQAVVEISSNLALLISTKQILESRIPSNEVPLLYKMRDKNTPEPKVDTPPVSNVVKDKEKKTKELIDKQKQKKEDLEKAANDKVNFLKDQTKVSPAGAKAAIVAVLLPVLSNFINAEKSANKIINRLISKTKKQLKNKGRVTVNGGKIVFTPKDNANYQQFKNDFDNKVKSLKKTINILKTTLDTLLKLLKVIMAALVAARVYLAILKARLASGDPTAAAEASAQIPPIEEKIKDYILVTTVLTAILSVFKRLVNRILIKLNSLSFTITQPNTLTSGTVSSDLINILNEPTPQTLEYEYTNLNNKEYIIRIITTPSGAKQAVAYEKFSNLKITQTAPSLVRNEDELLEELKQILG